MKLPGQLGEGGRNIPLAETSRWNMGSTLFQHLARIRKNEGVDPDRYPPVKSDIEYDTRRTMVGAEITARETAALILPAIRSAESVSRPIGGRGIRILSILITLLSIATTTLAWMTYRETRIANNRKANNRSKAEYLGLALMTNPKITLKLDGNNFVITSKRGVDELLDDSFRVSHNIPPEELERLYPK